jgi:hypothetical protein
MQVKPEGIHGTDTPAIFSLYLVAGQGEKKVPRILLVFFCIPVAPGKSRVIWAFPRNVGVRLHKITPRWLYHIGQNLILDSDIFLLHVEVTQVLSALSQSSVIQVLCNSCLFFYVKGVIVVSFKKRV